MYTSRVQNMQVAEFESQVEEKCRPESARIEIFILLSTSMS